MQAVRQGDRVYTASSRRIMLVRASMAVMYEYMYCSMLAVALGLPPVYGGAMSLGARVAVTFTRYAFGDGRKYFTWRMRAFCMALLALMLACTLALLVIYPVLVSAPPVWIVLAVVLALEVCRTLGHRLVGRRMRRTVGKRGFFGLMAGLLAAPACILGLLMYNNMPTNAALQMLLGYLVAIGMQWQGLWRERDLVAVEGAPDDIDAESVARMERELRAVSAYGAFQRLHMIVLIALQLTLVLVYTFIGFSTEKLLNCMLLTAGCALLMLEGTALCLRRMRKSFATQTLMVGVFLWMYGLILCYRRLGAPADPLMGYVSLCLCVSGLSVSVTALTELERRMVDVAAFTLKEHMRGYSQMRAASSELAMLLGQMLALVCLTLLCLPVGVRTADGLAAILGAFRPILVVPPLALVAAACASVLRFPMNNRHFQKLAKWLTLSSEGEDNPALKKQLDSVVVKRHKNRFGVKIIVTLLRPLYYHRVLGRERLAGYEDGDMILICNHGELYGPVVANLYIPVTFRPWVINTMMDREAIVEHMYRGTMMRQKWLPERLKRPLIRLITPVFEWVFDSLEAIPVYRDQPKKLLQTFRDTIEAMQAGDNILLFPEDDQPAAPGQKGYATEGVGKLYTGFAMIAQLYYAKTKRRAVFVPIYASKRLRTLTIGEGVRYDPAVPANEEKLRIVDALLDQMRRMAEAEEQGRQAQ